MRGLLFILIISTVLFATQIQKMEKSSATIDVQSDFPIGSSGIVIHHFDAEHSTIVARAILVAPNKIRFATFKALAQPNLPKPKLLPQVGDEVIMGYLYDRALIIAPNYQTYTQIANNLGLEWLHPDLFAAELAKAKHPTPTKQDFENFCDKFAVGKIVVALQKEAKVVDCYTFATLQTIPLSSDSNATKLPFYTRINKIPESLFDFFGPNEITDYYTYYTRLMEQK